VPGVVTLDFIKQYQTLIVGGLGFLGVMATIATNAWLARRQHSRQVRHDTKALRVALRSELEMIRDAFRDRVTMIESSQPKQREGIFIPLNTMTDVYSQFISRIGLLSESEIRAVMRAYLLVRQMPERLALLELQPTSHVERPTGFIFIEGRHLATVKQMHKNYLTDIDQALSLIAR
jgi:hypothetical protein